MDNLFNKTERLKQERSQCLENTNSKVSRFFKCLPLFFLELFCGIRYLPHYLRKVPYNGFPNLCSRDENGTWQNSYSCYLRYKRYSLTILTVLLIALGLGTSLFVFTVKPSKVLAAPTPCSNPYTVSIKLPATASLDLCVSDTFTFSGYWHDNDGAACPTEEPYAGQIKPDGSESYSTISTSTAIKVSSGTYSGLAAENLEGDTSPRWSQTLTANTSGTHTIRFVVNRQSGLPLASYYSPIRTINVESLPDWSTNTLSHSANTTSSITWTWTDLDNEDNYRVMDTEDNNKSGDLAADTTSWQETTGLSANTQYTRYNQAENECGSDDTSNKSVYTSIESPTGISFDSVGQNAITVSGTGTISNLSSGNSGIKFSESVTSTNSGWLQTNSWEKTGLTANKQYTFDAQTKNGDGDENSAIAGENKYTLAADASVSGDKTENAWTNSTNITFTNDAGFGEGGVEYYRYVFDKNATHTFNDTETQWTTGTKALTATSEGNWYLHAKAYNGDDIAAASGSTITLGPYKVDITAPSITNNQSGDNTWRNASGTTYDVDFLSNGGSPLDYAQYAVGTTQGATNIINWTNIFTNDTASYTSSWGINFASLQEGTNYVSFRTYDKAGNKKEVLTDGFYIRKDTVAANTSNIETDTETNSVTITWTTSEPTTTQVAWGPTSSYGNLTTEDTDLTTSHSVTISGLNENSIYHYKILGDDRAGNETAAADHTFTTAELEATVITDVQVTKISPTSVKITWTTNHAADSKVRYGLTTAYGDEVYESDLVTSHEITLTGLTPNTTYHYEVISTGNTTTYDADATFTTEAEEPEEPEEPTEYLASPTVISPADGSTINEARPLITGLSRSNNTIFIFIDSDLENTVLSTNHPSGTGSFAYKLRKNLTNGEHTLYTIARNSNGVYSDRSPKITFTLDFPYVTPTLFSPVFTDADNPEVIIRGVAYNNSTIKVYLDGEYFGEFTVTNNETYNTTSFNYAIPLSEVSVGNHVITTVAFDLEGHSSKTSNAVNFKKTAAVSKPSTISYQFGDEVRYTVVSGDSLWRIAERFYGNGADYIKIVEENQDTYPSLATNPSLIQVGWQLSIP